MFGVCFLNSVDIGWYAHFCTSACNQAKHENV